MHPFVLRAALTQVHRQGSGLAEDGSRSTEEEINPYSLRQENLSTLKQALLSLAWSKSADHTLASNAEEAASFSLASKVFNFFRGDVCISSAFNFFKIFYFEQWKTKAAEVGAGAKGLMPDGYCKSKKIDATALQAMKWKLLHEKTPTKVFFSFLCVCLMQC